MSGSTNGHVHADTKNTGHAPSPVELSRALSDPTRLRIISALLTGSKSLDTITKELGFDKKKKPIVRKHLEKLKESNLIFQVERGNYCLVRPELTNSVLEFLETSWMGFNETNSSLVKARIAYNNYIITGSEKDKGVFETEFDKLFETTFSRIGGQLRARFIKMAINGKYDLRRLRNI
jgi:DNA-binding transcriptional ArsR family regulator